MSLHPTEPALDSAQVGDVDEVEDLPLPEQEAVDSRDEDVQDDAPHVFDDDEAMQLGNGGAIGDEEDAVPAADGKSSCENPLESPASRSRRSSDAMADDSDAEAVEDDDLFAKLAAAPSSVAGLVTEWLARVQVNGPSAVADVLSLVVRLARPTGCPPLDAITPQMVITNDPSATVGDIGHLLRADVPGLVPASGKDPVSRKLRRAYEDFWRRLTAESNKVVLFDTDCFDTLISWLDAMTIARSRGLRIAACIAAFRLVDGFIDFGGRLRKELSSMQRQLATEKRKCGLAPEQGRVKGRGKRSARANASKPLSQKGKDLTKKVDEMTAHNSELVELSSKVFDSILVLKYRDVAAEIRTIAVTALGSWIMSYPDHFLDDKHTKYIGWLLSDKEPVVRRSTLEVLWRMLRKKEFFPSLEMFLQRFCDRITEMARDKDDTVAVAAIRLLTTLFDYELLDDRSQDSICDIALREPQTDIRRAAGGFLSRMICSANAVEEESSQENGSTGRRKVVSKKRKQSSREHHNSGLAEIPSLSRSQENLRELLFAITRDNGDDRSAGEVVDAVWDHLPALRCWDAFAAILAAERNMDENESSAQAVNASSKQKSSRDEDGDDLKGKDLALICEMLVASVREASGHGDSHRAAIVRRGERDSVDTPSVKFSTIFLPELPLLLVQFQADVRALCALVRLPVYFEMNCLEQEGQETHFKDILSKLVDLMSRHTGSPKLVMLCAETLKVLSSDNNPLKSLTLATLQRACLAASKELALHVRTDLSAAEPLSVTASVLRVRVMSELAEPNASVSSSIVRLLQYQVEKGPCLTDDVTADAARTCCAVVAWCLAKIRERLEPTDGQDDCDKSLVHEAIKDVQERGSLMIDLLGQICSSASFSISSRMVCLQGLLTTLTLCNGVEKFSASKGFLQPVGGNESAEENTGTNTMDFLGARAALDVLAGAVRSCVLAIIEHVLETLDHSLIREPRNGKMAKRALPETEVRDCFASLVQSSFQSVLSPEIVHLPILGLLLKHKKAHSVDPIPSEWTTVQLSRRYCQQRQVREAVRIQQEVRALRDVADMHDDEGLQLVRHLADAVLALRTPGEATEMGASHLLEGLIHMVVDSRSEAADLTKDVRVLTEAGFALVGRLAVRDAVLLLTKLQPVRDIVQRELVRGSADMGPMFATFCKCLESIADDETPDIPKLPKRPMNDTARRGKPNARRRRRAPMDGGAYHSSSPVETSNVRRSRRGTKRIDYARLSGLSEDGNRIDEQSAKESGTDDDESQMTRAEENAKVQVAAADVSRDIMAFTHSPRVPVKACDSEADRLPLGKNHKRKSESEGGPIESSSQLPASSSLCARSSQTDEEHEGSKITKDDDIDRDPSEHRKFTLRRISEIPVGRELATEGDSSGKHAGGDRLPAKPFTEGSKGSPAVPKPDAASSVESNSEGGHANLTAAQLLSGNLSMHASESESGAKPDTPRADGARTHKEKENEELLRRSRRKEKSLAVDRAIQMPSERDSMSPTRSKKSSDRKATDVEKAASIVQGSKLTRAKRGRHHAESTEDKENIEDSLGASSAVNHSSPSQPVVRRTKRRKRW